MDDLFQKNLDHITYELDLFGHKIEHLSMKERIGFLPISIWQPEWSTVAKLKEKIGDYGQCREGVLRAGWQEKSCWNSGEGGLTSIFNPHLAQMILSAYAPQGARIYDPFAGGGCRGFIARAMGHTYDGVELRREETDRIRAKMIELDLYFGLVCADSQLFRPNSRYNFCYTCPPYFNLEVYSKQEGDLSNTKDFAAFMAGLTLVLDNCYTILEPGSYCVFVVGNFRQKNGELIHFNGALAAAARAIGFRLHDELIFWGASQAAAQRAGQFAAHRKSVRVHEYILVFQK